MAQQAARAYWRFTFLWLITGIVIGIVCSADLISADFLLPHPVLKYGRVLGAHRAIMVHGFLFMAVFASGYSVLPGLTRSMKAGSGFSTLLAWAGSLIVLAGVIAILSGNGAGQEFSDLPAGFAFAFWIYLALVGVDLGFIYARNLSSVEHPSLGLIIPSVVAPAVIYPFTLPDWWGTGVFAELRMWSAWSTIAFCVFLLGGLGLSLYISATGEYRIRISKGLFTAGLITLIVLSPYVGISRLLDSPLPVLIKVWGTFAAVLTGASVCLLVAVMWRTPSDNPPAYLRTFGLIGIFLASIQLIAYVIPPVHTAVHYTENISANSHLALGSLACLITAGALVLMPKISRTELPHLKNIRLSIILFILGITGVVIFQHSAGMVQVTAFARSLATSDWQPTFKLIQVGVFISGLCMLAGVLNIARMVILTAGSSTPDTKGSLENPVRHMSKMEGQGK